MQCDYEKLKEEIINLLKVRKKHCSSIAKLKESLEKVGCDIDLPSLYKTLRRMNVEGLVKIYYAGEIYLTGMIREDSVSLWDGTCVPEGYVIKVEKAEAGVNEDIATKVKRIDKNVSAMAEECIEIRRDVTKIKQDAEMAKDLLFDLFEMIKKLKEK